MPKQKQEGQLGETRELPPGVKLVRTLEGHEDAVLSVAFDPTGRMLASGSNDNTIRLWEASSGKLLRTLEGHENSVWCAAFDSSGQVLASGGRDRIVKLWEVASGELIRTFNRHENSVAMVAFDASGLVIASGSFDTTVKLWEVASGRLIRNLEGHKDIIYSVAFDPTGQTLASGGSDTTVKLWEVASGRLIRNLEGHTGSVHAVAFSEDGRLLASRGADETLRLWSCETWKTVAVIPELTKQGFVPDLAFHPTLPLLAAVGSMPDALYDELCNLIHLYELDLDVLLSKTPGIRPAIKAVHHTTAKIVLVGDSGVGKTGLGWRLAHGEFKEHASTHGQQFWVVNELGTRRQDGPSAKRFCGIWQGSPITD